MGAWQVFLGCLSVRCGYMTGSHWARISAILVLALSLVLLVCFLGQRREPLSGSSEQETFAYPLRITGLSYSTYDDKCTIKMEADEIKVHPRKHFVFNIRPFDEATLTNARLEVHLKEGGSLEIAPFSIGRDLLSLNEKGKPNTKGTGLITRGVVKGLAIEIYRGNELSLVVKAQEAIVDFKRKEARLAMANIENRLSQETITSSSVVWSDKEKVFKIPGAYQAVNSAGRVSGKGLRYKFVSYPQLGARSTESP